MLALGVGRESFHEVEEATPPQSDMGTVLDVVRRPVSLGGLEVTLIEQNIEIFKQKSLVLFLRCLRRVILLFNMRASAMPPIQPCAFGISFPP
jgi:hypothetical protein